MTLKTNHCIESVIAKNIWFWSNPVQNLLMLVILYWGLCNPNPCTKYSFFFIAKKSVSRCCRCRLALSKRSRTTLRRLRFKSLICQEQKYTLDKKEKQRRLKTVTKFNLKLVNLLPLRQHEFFRCFIKWL